MSWGRLSIEDWEEYQSNKEYKCMNCGLISKSKEMLTATSPFDAEDTLTACPKCRSMDDFKEMCETAGCTNGATMGMRTDDKGGYMRLCYEHGKVYL